LLRSKQKRVIKNGPRGLRAAFDVFYPNGMFFYPFLTKFSFAGQLKLSIRKQHEALEIRGMQPFSFCNQSH
jgi:hypothetical protein